MLYEFILSHSAVEAARNIAPAFGTDSPSERTVRCWFAKFPSGDFDLEDKPGRGRRMSLDDQALRAAMETKPDTTTQQLTESARVRLLCEKLDSNSFEKFQRHVLPKEVTSIGFDETVETLKQLFDVKASEFTTRYQCLKLEKTDSEDYLTYTGKVNEFCERAKIHELDCDGIKCLLWIFGLKSQREAEIRQRLRKDLLFKILYITGHMPPIALR
ncbi:hypothetical protein Y032_0004g1823 [Ancylostoma ceylanicum]|uniref:Uncharacterized protein n=1 Tax=Ancylostoma ceylanicum TaxID=53326 RepID=A0A016VU58_9BILA|nr:hypothetical protein Y032_0004g1823 [Ancylostoma ceylanicum]